MKNVLIAGLLIASSFLSGFVLKTIITPKPDPDMKKVTGIGGVFFKCKDPDKLKEWYHDKLGLPTDEYGASFQWYENAEGTKKGRTQWSLFPETTNYFKPSGKEFMINYRVENLEALLEDLKKAGVIIIDKIETYDFGKFVHVLDPEGNAIELWEPAGE